MAVNLGDGGLVIFRRWCRGLYAAMGDLVEEVYDVVVCTPAELDT